MIKIKVVDEYRNICVKSKYIIIKYTIVEEPSQQQSINLPITNYYEDHYQRNKYQQPSNKSTHRSNKAIKQGNHSCYKKKMYCSRNT
jgi:hypothetical protein